MVALLLVTETLQGSLSPTLLTFALCLAIETLTTRHGGLSALCPTTEQGSLSPTLLTFALWIWWFVSFVPCYRGSARDFVSILATEALTIG